jgi:pyruvate dehydrogenase E1 component
VILAKTVKGWTLGPGVEARNITHQAKKLSEAELRIFRDRLELPIPDSKLKDAPFYHPGPESPEIQYLLERRAALGGPLPRRCVAPRTLDVPGETVFGEFAAGSGGQAVSTTMAFSKLLRNLLRDPDVGRRIVPIVPDEARTFGMDPLFKEVGIYAARGQRYDPVDSNLVLSYREATDGQVLEEGITEAGSSASFQAAATSYASHAEPMLPFYIFYSMFGFQRTGDEFWAAADVRSRGFLMGATAGRTTLHGEGLQHDDGQSLLLATTMPSVRAYDPAFAFETAAIVREGIAAMHQRGEDVVYYLTLYNENYVMPPMPDGVREGIVGGLYLFRPAGRGTRLRATLLGSGSIMQQVLRAQELLAERFDVAADVWSATSYQILRRDALAVERWNRLHPAATPRVARVTAALADAAAAGPVVAATDFLRAGPDQVARWVPGTWLSLGTDGFGRSDAREALRRYFEVDAEHVAAAALAGLTARGSMTGAAASRAMAELGVDPDAPDPLGD